MPFTRYKNNPILIPIEKNLWESKAVFNCGVVNTGKKIRLLYRAIGEYEKYISRIGYAHSNDGLNFDRSEDPAIVPEFEFEKYGVEDPRITKINDDIYVTYTVLSNYVNKNPTVFSALIKTQDFRKFDRKGIVTKTGNSKNLVLFPEKFTDTDKISDKFYYWVHRPSDWTGIKHGTDKPGIWLGIGKSLTEIKKNYLLLRPEHRWEERKIGPGPPPIKTKYGWLLVYHAVDNNYVYRVGAAMLDLDNPRKILFRTKLPIMEPEATYEKYGYRNNVIFPTGMCLIDNKIYLYYGGADKVCCLAVSDIEELIEYIQKTSLLI